MSTQSRVVITCAVLVLGAASAWAEYELSWSTVDGGGGTSTGGGYELSGTIGQPDASAPAAMTGGDYQLTGGFWVVPGLSCSSFAAFDFDRDCDVDAADLGVFQSCVSGPDLPHAGTALCQSTDLDDDGDVDQDDYGIFQLCFSGADRPADPGCAD